MIKKFQKGDRVQVKNSIPGIVPVGAFGTVLWRISSDNLVSVNLDEYGQRFFSDDDLKESPDYEAILRATIAQHIAVAAQYEKAGRMKDTARLRGVANLLGVILFGKVPSTSLPPLE